MKIDSSILTPEEKKVIIALQDGIPLAERPFHVLAEKAGLSEDTFIGCVKGLQERGYIRRLGATLQHQMSGYAANAMVAWRIPEEEIERVGALMTSSFPQITHCYLRRTFPEWPFNLYTMVHASTEPKCILLVEKISRAVGISDYQLLFSEKELKRSNVRYFREG